jgi:hypothetical protein
MIQVIIFFNLKSIDKSEIYYRSEEIKEEEGGDEDINLNIN